MNTKAVNIDKLIEKLQPSKIDVWTNDNKRINGHTFDKVIRLAIGCLEETEGWSKNDADNNDLLIEHIKSFYS